MGPERAPRVSVVVPTYNRGPRLRDTVQALLESRLDRGGPAELIVVDDGSAVPVDLRGVTPPAGFALRVVRQDNAGPAAARNAGFRVAAADIVLFVDDDILVPGGLIEQHLAAHERLGPAVVCGRCVLEPRPEERRLYAFLESLGHDPGGQESHEFVRMEVVASGQISVPRSAFPVEGVYRQELKTPAAEEFELATRLRARGVPVFLATRIVAVHLQPIDIHSISRQQYKHGLGYGEVAAKCPETLGLPALASVILANGPAGTGAGPGARARRALRHLVSTRPIRRSLLELAALGERIPVPERLQARLYHAAISSHFVAGVRHGLKTYGGSRPTG
ncbi:MAG TPA: glycosyltransferase [Vicinamibacteria bacterium]|nr:glycosyltransferase [Vicinamibacteria bacterium]